MDAPLAPGAPAEPLRPMKEIVMTLKELENRVKIIQDVEEIKKMHRYYVFCLSNRQWKEMIDCFSKDAVAEIGDQGVWRGKDRIAVLIGEVIAGRNVKVKPKGGHILINPIITVEGDTAKGDWFLSRFVYNQTAPGGPAPKLDRGRYDCEYVREDGKWKFSYLKWVCPWPEEQAK